MSQEIILASLGGAAIAWVVPQFFNKTIGTRYRTEKDCDACETRNAVQEIRTLVVELAIKAGVPAQEVSKFIGKTGHRRANDG